VNAALEQPSNFTPVRHGPEELLCWQCGAYEHESDLKQCCCCESVLHRECGRDCEACNQTVCGFCVRQYLDVRYCMTCHREMDEKGLLMEAEEE